MTKWLERAQSVFQNNGETSTPGIRKAAALSENLGTKSADTGAANHWRVHFPNRESLEIFFSPDASLRQVLADYPDAVAAEAVIERQSAENKIAGVDNGGDANNRKTYVDVNRIEVVQQEAPELTVWEFRPEKPPQVNQDR
jgi:hypothetical protein